jgi:hypothetical protein
VDPVQDPLLLRKSGGAGNRTKDHWVWDYNIQPNFFAIYGVAFLETILHTTSTDASMPLRHTLGNLSNCTQAQRFNLKDSRDDATDFDPHMAPFWDYTHKTSSGFQQLQSFRRNV